MYKNTSRKLHKKMRSMPPITPSEKHLNNTVLLSQTAYHNRRQLPPFHLFQFTVRQARLIAAPIWVVQGLVLLGLCLLYHTALTDQILSRHAGLLLPVAAVFTTLAGLPFLVRSFRHRMQELELSTRLSLSRLMLARFVVVGAGDIVILLAILILSVGRLAMPVGTALVCTLLPFLLAAVACLFILQRMRGSHALFACAAACALLAALLGLLFAQLPKLPPGMLPGIGGALCVLCTVLLLLQCRAMVQRIGHTEYAAEGI